MHKSHLTAMLLAGILLTSCTNTESSTLPEDASPDKTTTTSMETHIDRNKENKQVNFTSAAEKPKTEGMDTATLAAGCFWCIEAVFQELEGVQSVISGYAGGHVKNPTYRQVTTGETGHAEVAQIIYDPNVISFDEMLEVFWMTHDPTTLNRQGNDIGTQYRSAIFYHNEEQKKLATQYKQALDESGAFSNPIVTEIVPYTEFYEAENYHQNYYSLNPNQGYCSYVIRPKMEKFRKVFKDKLRKEKLAD